MINTMTKKPELYPSKSTFQEVGRSLEDNSPQILSANPFEEGTIDGMDKSERRRKDLDKAK